MIKAFFMKSPQREASSQAKGISSATLVAISLTSAVLLSACSKPHEKTEDIRPVRAVQATLQDSESVAEFADRDPEDPRRRPSADSRRPQCRHG